MEKVTRQEIGRARLVKGWRHSSGPEFYVHGVNFVVAPLGDDHVQFKLHSERRSKSGARLRTGLSAILTDSQVVLLWSALSAYVAEKGLESLVETEAEERAKYAAKYGYADEVFEAGRAFIDGDPS
jgi:hypothetical protein